MRDTYLPLKRKHQDHPVVQALCRDLGVPGRFMGLPSWPRFVLFPRIAQLHRRLK